MSGRAFAKTLVVAHGALLRARVEGPGLLTLETVEPHRRRTWRAVREADLERHVQAWRAERGLCDDGLARDLVEAVENGDLSESEALKIVTAERNKPSL